MTDLADVPGVEQIGSGKVRELFAVGDDQVLLVATDRISAFDVILPTLVPDKGKVLTGLTDFWLDRVNGLVDDHRISTDVEDFPDFLSDHAEWLRGRAMLCRRVEVVPIECVARGYLAGSGWAEYQATGTVCGVSLPEGLSESEALPEPIFTPSTKAVEGHDENLTFDEAAEVVGGAVAEQLRQLTLTLYRTAHDYARERGIILADTKFEFGWLGQDLLLVDEVLTPDSSRFWPADTYQPGRAQPSYDKQFVRDWLREAGWDKTPPAPELPHEVVDATSQRYRAAYEALTGQALEEWTA
jgi:phosphoribosylaminoimidazole-succinocarboxamide synthase